MREYFHISLAVAGNFQKQLGMNAHQNYGIIKINKEQSESFFLRLSTTIPQLKEQLKKLQNYGRNWLYTWNPLAEKPLISFDKEFPERLICPISHYLLQRTVRGIFYDIVKAPGFSDAFGASFQKYVGEVLKETCKSGDFVIHHETQYLDGKKKKHGVDWILSDQNANIFIECKTKRMTIDAKFIVTKEALNKDLQTLANTIVQNYKNINDALSGKTAWQPNQSVIYPLILTLEDWFIFAPMIIDKINKLVIEGLQENNIPPNVLQSMPYTIASIEEFEFAAQVINEVGIQNFLQAKTTENYKTWSLLSFASTKFKEHFEKVPKYLFEEDWKKMTPDAIQ